RSAEHCASAAFAVDLDWNSLWTVAGEPGRQQRSTRTAGRDQAAHGGCECHHVVLIPAAQWSESYPAPGARHHGMDGTARIRIRAPDARQHEPEALPRSKCVRARPVHAGREESAARAAKKLTHLVIG